MPSEFYNEEEAEAILKEASRQSAMGAAMSRDRLLQTAAELGIPAEAVEAAEREHRAKTVHNQLAQEFQLFQRSRFFGRAWRYMLIGLCFLLAYFGLRETEFWVLIVAGFMLLRAVALVPEHLMPSTAAYQTAFSRWKRKREPRDQ